MATLRYLNDYELYTDASSDHERKLSTYGVILEGPDFQTIKLSSQVPYDSNIEVIEAEALVAGLDLINKWGLKNVRASTDSSRLISSLDRPNGKESHRLSAALKLIRKGISQKKISLILVKRHMVDSAHKLAREVLHELRGDINEVRPKPQTQGRKSSPHN